MADCFPVLESQIAALDDWADANARPGDVTDRAVGTTPARYRGVGFAAGLRPYTLWIVRRVLDQYAALGDAGRSAVDAALSGTGWDGLLKLSPRHRVERRGFELVWT